MTKKTKERIKNEQGVKKQIDFNLLNVIPEGAYVIDTNGVCVFVNDQFLKILGFGNKDEVIGSKIHNLIHHHYSSGKIYPESECSIETTIFEEQEKFYGEGTLFKKDGTKISVEFSAAPLFQDDDIIKAIVTFKNISELKKSQERFKKLFNNAPFAYQSLNETGHFIEVNEKWLDLFGYKKEEVIGEWFGDFLTAENKDKFKKRFKHFKQRGSVHSEFQMITKYGDIIDVVFDGEIGYTPNHTFEQTHCIVKDVTELRYAQNKMKYEQNVSELYLDVTSQMMLVINEEGIVTMINEAGAKILEDEKDNIIGKNWFDNFLDPEFKDTIFEVFKDTFEKESVSEAYNYENVIKTAKNNDRIIKWKYTLLHDINKTIIGVLSSGSDVTKQREYENELIKTSTHDELTGLYNRRFYEEKIHEFEKENIYPFSIILADINGLKLVNDAFGHQEGDFLLKKASDLLLSHASEDAIVCRLGGDEFVILLPNTNSFDAEKLVSKIDEHTSEVKKENIELSISFGVASREEVEISLVELFRIAEDRMYQSKLIEVPSMRSNAINTIMKTLNEKDHYSESHVKNVSKLSENLAHAMDLSISDIKEIHTAGLLHDIGKIIIPTTILNKKGKLTNEEYNIIKSHSEIGFRILNSSAEMRSISKVVLHHHERWDGKGYPHQLKEKEIPLKSRIICVTDAFDAMTTERTYKKTLSKKEALEELIRCSGTQFDPKIVSIFKKNFDTIIEGIAL